MPALTLRRLTEDHLRWLRLRAAAHGRSVNAEILDIIAVAQVDELAQEHPRNPFLRSWRKARSLGIRTASTAQRSIRADRGRSRRP